MVKTFHPLLWSREVDYFGNEWTFYLTSPDLTEDLLKLSDNGVPVYGFCDRSTREIYINAAYSVLEQDDSWLHETMHMHARKSRLGSKTKRRVLRAIPKHMRARVRKALEEMGFNGEMEEEYTDKISTRLIVTLNRRRLEVPKRPVGYHSLARHARRVQAEIVG